MRQVKIIFQKPHYELPEGMNGKEWKEFSRDYFYLIEAAKLEAIKQGKPDVTIQLDTLPILFDDITTLRLIMSKCKTVSEWNEKRESAKSVFTFPCICELDASGYISKVLKKVKTDA